MAVWKDVWNDVSDEEIDLLRCVLERIAALSRSRISDEAGIHEHDLRNFLARNSKRPKFRSGLRMLRFATQWDFGHRDSQLEKNIKSLKEVVIRIKAFDPDDDHLFRHLNALGILDEERCTYTCRLHAGNYYAFRLGRDRDTILKTHIEIRPYNIYEKVPSFINRMHYGKAGDSAFLTRRTARGHVIPLDQSYVFVGYVHYGINDKNRERFRGIQINVFSAEQFDRVDDPVIDGVFLSYIYGGRYEYGPLKLLRRVAAFDRNNSGVYGLNELPASDKIIEPHELKRDVSNLVLTSTHGVLLSACMSYGLRPPRSGQRSQSNDE